MRKLTAVALLLFVAITSPLIAADLKIGIVSLARLLDESPQAQNSSKLLQSEFAPRDQALGLLQRELSSEETELLNNGPTMTESNRREAGLKLSKKQRDFDRQKESFLSDLNGRRNEVLGKLQSSLMEEVNKFAEQNNYDLIIGEGVLYASASVDITSQVLSALQASFQNSN